MPVRVELGNGHDARWGSLKVLVEEAGLMVVVALCWGVAIGAAIWSLTQWRDEA